MDKDLIKVAEQGDADAQFRLGSCYYRGKDVPQDYAKATEWYTKSTKNKASLQRKVTHNNVDFN